MENLSFNKPKKNTKIAVAMSGGVDSSVTAAMLKKSGYDVEIVILPWQRAVDTAKSGKMNNKTYRKDLNIVLLYGGIYIGYLMKHQPLHLVLMEK